MFPSPDFPAWWNSSYSRRMPVGIETRLARMNIEFMFIYTHTWIKYLFTGIYMDGLWNLLPTNCSELDFVLPSWLWFCREIFRTANIIWSGLVQLTLIFRSLRAGHQSDEICFLLIPKHYIKMRSILHMYYGASSTSDFQCCEIDGV